MEPITLAAIAGLQLILLTLVQGFVQSRKERRDSVLAIETAAAQAALKKKEREEDYARQDLVAERVAAAAREVKAVATQAADAAELLLKAQAETVARTDEVARLASEADRRIAEQLTAIDEQGKKIHILVNSDMTAARTAERDSLRALALVLRRLSPDAKDEIVRVEKRITELDQILADRHAAQLRVEEEARAHEAGR